MSAGQGVGLSIIARSPTSEEYEALCRAVGWRGWIAYTYPFNVAGVPAIVLPAGRTGAGLPVGLQLVARRLDDARLLAAAAAYEQLAPWADRWPPVAAEPASR